MLRVDHVVIVVVREARAHSIARLARAAMADAIREHDVIPRRVEQLPRPEQLSGERAREKAGPRAGGAVQHDDCVANDAVGVLPRRAEGDVVNAQLGQRGAVGEVEIVDDEVGAGARRLRCRSRRDEGQYRDAEESSNHWRHQRFIADRPDTARTRRGRKTGTIFLKRIVRTLCPRRVGALSGRVRVGQFIGPFKRSDLGSEESPQRLHRGPSIRHPSRRGRWHWFAPTVGAEYNPADRLPPRNHVTIPDRYPCLCTIAQRFRASSHTSYARRFAALSRDGMAHDRSEPRRALDYGGWKREPSPRVLLPRDRRGALGNHPRGRHPAAPNPRAQSPPPPPGRG